jgi:hypothetical protein
MVEGVNIKVRYQHAGFIPDYRIAQFLRRVAQHKRTPFYENGELIWALPRAEIAFMKLTATVVGAAIGFILLVLICRGCH